MIDDRLIASTHCTAIFVKKKIVKEIIIFDSRCQETVLELFVSAVSLQAAYGVRVRKAHSEIACKFAGTCF